MSIRSRPHNTDAVAADGTGVAGASGMGFSALRWVACAALASWLGGCGPAHITRIVVPLQNNEAGAVEAETCALQCRSTRSYERCLAACPGAVVQEGGCAPEEVPPVAICSSVMGTTVVDRVTDTPDAEPKASSSGTAGAALEAAGALVSLVGAAVKAGSKKEPASTPDSRPQSEGAPQRAERTPAPPPASAHTLAKPERASKEKKEKSENDKKKE